MWKTFDWLETNFLINKKIYYAGDLHYWYWKGEPDNQIMHKKYINEMEKLWSYFDVSFIVLDPRLEEYYDLGILEFTKHTQSKHIFPMHQFSHYELTIDLLKKHPELQNIHMINHKGQTFII